MKKVDFSNVKNILLFNLKLNKKTILIHSVCLVLFIFFYMAMFPSVKELAGAKLEALPDEILAIIGTDKTADMSNYNSYFGMIFPIFVIISTIMASVFSASSLRKEEENSTIEFLYSQAISREEIFISKYLLNISYLFITLSLSILVSVICGLLFGGESYLLIESVSNLKLAILPTVLFSGIALSLAGFSPKIGSTSIVLGFVMVPYLLGYLSQILGESAQFLKYLSPMTLLNFNFVSPLTTNLIICVFIYFVIYFIAILFSYKRYSKRDFII